MERLGMEGEARTIRERLNALPKAAAVKDVVP